MYRISGWLSDGIEYIREYTQGWTNAGDEQGEAIHVPKTEGIDVEVWQVQSNIQYKESGDKQVTMREYIETYWPSG